MTDQRDRLVQRVEDDLEAFEDVDASLELRQVVLQPAHGDVEAEIQEGAQDAQQIQPIGAGDLWIVRGT